MKNKRAKIKTKWSRYSRPKPEEILRPTYTLAEDYSEHQTSHKEKERKF